MNYGGPSPRQRRPSQGVLPGRPGTHRVGGGSMTLKKKIIYIIISTFMVIMGAYAVCLHEMICRYGLPVLDNPTVETRTTMYVIPWPWELEWQDGGFVMRLEVWR